MTTQAPAIVSKATPQPALARNFAINVIGESLWGFQWNMVLSSTVLVTLLERFGATATMLSGIAAVEAAGFVLPQLIGAYLFRSRARRKVQVLLWHLLVMIPLLPVIGAIVLLSGRLPPLAVRWALLLTYAAYIFSIGTIGSVWWDWIAHLFDQRHRGRVFGVSFCASAGAGALGAWGASQVLARLSLPQGYGLLYLLAGVIAATGMSCFFFVRDPAADEPDPAPPTLSDLLSHFRASLADTNFRALLIGRGMLMAGFCTPLITVYFTSPEGGRLDSYAVVRAGGTMAIVTAATNLTLGYVGDHHGHRLGILTGASLQVLTLVLLLTLSGFWGAVAVYAAAGVFMSAAFISHNNLLFETCPHRNRLAHITVGNLVLAPIGIAAPLIAGWAANPSRLGPRAVFALCLVPSILALAWLALRFREPRTLRRATEHAATPPHGSPMIDAA